MYICREGHLDMAKLLLENMAEVNIPSGSESNIPLTLACWKGTVVCTYVSELKIMVRHRLFSNPLQHMTEQIPIW